MSMRVDLHTSVKELVVKYHIEYGDAKTFWIDLLENLEWYDSVDAEQYEIDAVEDELAKFERVQP